jgi:hypothetical protein
MLFFLNRSVSLEPTGIWLAFAPAEAHESVNNDFGRERESGREDEARLDAQIENGASLERIGMGDLQKGAEDRKHASLAIHVSFSLSSRF